MVVYSGNYVLSVNSGVKLMITFLAVLLLIICIIGMILQFMYGTIGAYKIWDDFYYSKICGRSRTYFNPKEEFIEKLLSPFLYIHKDLDYLNSAGKIILYILVAPFAPGYLICLLGSLFIMSPFYLFLYIFRKREDK